MYDVIVIGGGAAGMMSALISAKNNKKVLLIEKNEKLGKKLYITGKGRCNITNNCDPDKLLNGIVKNEKFLYSAFSLFNNKDMIELLSSNGLEVIIEQGDRVFPKSQKSSDVIKFFINNLTKNNVDILLNTVVKKIIVANECVLGIATENNDFYYSNNLIVATGGKSYPLTGSTGDGYEFAKATGHRIVEPYPSLVPMILNKKSLYDLQGLALKNVEVTLYIQTKKITSRFGEILFTHDGVSGPVILNLSTIIPEYKDIMLTIDLKPALNHEKLNNRILRDFANSPNKDISNVLKELLPSRLIKPILSLAKIREDKKVNQINSLERKSLIDTMKSMPLYVNGNKGFEEAIITGGGICIKDISSSTMQSKKIKGLDFVGEVLDVHALTGGYNLQIAFSTAFLAANSIL
jgi:predicted Rossmann fold flavoprotein